MRFECEPICALCSNSAVSLLAVCADICSVEYGRVRFAFSLAQMYVRFFLILEPEFVFVCSIPIFRVHTDKSISVPHRTHYVLGCFQFICRRRRRRRRRH